MQPIMDSKAFNEWFTREFNDVEYWCPIAEPDDKSVINSGTK